MTTNYWRISLGMLFGGLLLITQAAHAASWSSSASVCTPDNGSSGRYAFNDASFTFTGVNTGDISARCHITNPFDDTNSVPGWNTLTVGYQDPDGTSLAHTYTVKAKLVRVSKGTGAVVVISTFDSDAGAGSSAPTSRQIHFTHNWDFGAYAYYVTLTLSRSSSTLNPAVWFVKLSLT